MYPQQTTLSIAQEEPIHGICDACNHQKALVSTHNPFNEIVTGIYNSYYKIGGKLVPINKTRARHW